MGTQKFKTDIKCGGCIAKVTPFLNEIKEIVKWSVDTASSDKILTVEGEVAAGKVTDALKHAGYKAEPLMQG